MAVKQPEDGLVGLAPVEPRPVLGRMPNAPHQTFPGFMGGASYRLAVVEFDDQGRCYDRRQMDGIAGELDRLTEARMDVILLVFVHGWKHDARSDDENLSAFRVLLAKTAEHEHAFATAGEVPRPVLGVFVGWRGLSEFASVDAVADATFWTRQAAGHRVATGSVRELFARLRRYRNARLDAGGAPLLVIAGHSFGGMIVYSALSQSLIEAATTPAAEVVPRFADLVLLVNPAIEGARYIPIQDLVASAAFEARRAGQLPVFICAQAENDGAVGQAFRLGNARDRLTQSTIGDLERDCVTRAIGFVPAFRTHRLEGGRGSEPFVLTPPGSAATNPFWVVGVDKAVIDGHGGIWQEPFLLFLASIVFQRVHASKRTTGIASTAARGSADLAAFAKTLAPIKLPR